MISAAKAIASTDKSLELLQLLIICHFFNSQLHHSLKKLKQTNKKAAMSFNLGKIAGTILECNII